MRHYLYLLIFTLLTVVSCETDLPEGTWSKEPPVNPENPVTYQLSIDKTIIVAKAEGSSEAFNITSDDSWTVSASEAWIKVSDTTGAGDKSVTVTVEANTGKEARSGTITVKGKSSGTKSISVSQSGMEYSLSVDKTEITVGAADASETFTITSNDDWTVSASETWVMVSDATGSGNKTITVTIDANTNKEGRTATITISGNNSGAKPTITVSQEGKVFTLSVDKTTITAGSSGSTEAIAITSDDSWTATSDVSWAELSATSGSGDKTITVTISLNTTTTERTGTITVKGLNSGISKTITITQSGKSALDTNGHEYVDLGLPSGLLWATCNVGAKNPEDYGDYFAWGATKPQSVYDWAHTPYQTQNTTSYSSTKFTKYLGSTTSGYKDSSAKDLDALKTVLDFEDDAAHVNWGGSWRMPTKAEQDELSDTSNCTWTWTTQNGVHGYKVTSKKNGASLFLPAAGYRYDTSLDCTGSDGNYWSSSLFSSYRSHACVLHFNSSGVGWNDYDRYNGLSVRPVCASSE